ncbi:MAG: hypothetical protein C4318_00735 [Acidimicrobiia bacterium]
MNSLAISPTIVDPERTLAHRSGQGPPVELDAVNLDVGFLFEITVFGGITGPSPLVFRIRWNSKT